MESHCARAFGEFVSRLLHGVIALLGMDVLDVLDEIVETKYTGSIRTKREVQHGS